MAKPEEIPYLITLLDDPSEEIHERVENELLAFGPSLERLTGTFINKLEGESLENLKAIFGKIRKKEFDKSWLKWLEIQPEEKALEYAFSRLAYLAHGYEQPPLTELLDGLVAKFNETGLTRTIPNLMQFVFRDLGFNPPSEIYYDPSLSNLVHVIQHKEGIQISLSCICILLAPRLGLRIKGLNIPGHFMTFTTQPNGNLHIYDSFQQGKSLSRQAVLKLEYSLKVQNKTLTQMEAQPFEIILRVLRNIINARIHIEGPRPDDLYKGIFDNLVQNLQDRGILLL